MNQGRTVFSQLLNFLPDREFRRCVARYGGDVRPRGFSCWDQYLSMAFAQLTYRDGLRDIEACLRSLGGKLYHMGFHGRVARSTLADANDACGILPRETAKDTGRWWSSPARTDSAPTPHRSDRTAT